MNVLLTQPRLPTLYQKPKEPPLNLAILAAVLEGQGFTVKCLDMEAHEKSEYTQTLNEYSPQIVGLSATTMGVLSIAEMAEEETKDAYDLQNDLDIFVKELGDLEFQLM